VTNDLPFARHGILPAVTRPAVLGGVLIAGISVAALGFVAGLVFAGYGAAVYLNSTAARDRLLRDSPLSLPVSAPSQPVGLTTPAVTAVGPRGLGPAQRAALLDAIGQRIEMTPEQARQLDALLAADGAEIFVMQAGELVSAPAILDQIGDHVGRLPSAEGAEPFYFETAAGRTEVYDNRSLFYGKHRLNPIRAVAGRRANQTRHPVLLPSDVSAIVGLAEDACARDIPRGKPLNDVQVQTLRSMLADPQQQLVSLLATPDGDQFGINGAVVRVDGYATIAFSGGPLMLGPAGNIILQSDLSSVPAVSGAACGWVIVAGLISVGMAVFLLIICLTLRREPRRRLGPLVQWSAIKIALSIVAASAVTWMTWSFFNSSTASHPTAGSGSILIFIGAIVLAMGCAYPIAVLLIARSRGVREYYDPTA
jgi:hypothetical protein